MCSIFSAGKYVVSTILMIQLFCYEAHPGCLNVFPCYQYSKQVCGSLFICGDISKCQVLNLSRLCSEMLLMVAVPATATQPGLKDRSSMARTSEASLSAESWPRITTWLTHRKPSRNHSVISFTLSIQSIYLCALSVCVCIKRFACSMYHMCVLCQY